MRVPPHDASAPHATLPSARLACTVKKFIATARARTHAGAALCVAAPRLASTPTHAAPAPNAPTSATAVMVVAATSVDAITHSSAKPVTTLLSE